MARQIPHWDTRAIADSNDEVAAFILEPMSGATLGAVVPPPGYLSTVARICRENDVLLIADEVMTGMGRTGRNFAMEHSGATPDIIVAAKGLSSGYAPLGAVLASQKIVDAIAAGSGSFLHGFTYNAHPISLSAGKAVLSFLKENKLVHAADSEKPGSIASKLKSELNKLLDLKAVGDVRGMGLLWGVEFVSDRKTKAPFDPKIGFSAKIAEATARRGVLVYPMQGCVDGISGDHLLLAPPAVITESEIAWAVEQLRDAIVETLA